MSSDGTRLAYTQGPRLLRIYGWLSFGVRIAPGRRQRTANHASDQGHFEVQFAKISADGKWIAYVTEGHIYKMTVEGGMPIQLTFSNATEFSPAWSPDGKRIAFGSNEGGGYKVWIVDADGAHRRQFAETQLEDEAGCEITWSPGRQILYQRREPEYQYP